MSLDITNLLSSLKNYYNSQNSAGKKYTGTDEDMSRLAASYGASATNTIALTRDGEGKITRTIVENGVRVTVSAEKETLSSSSKPNSFALSVINFSISSIIIFYPY